MVKNKSIFSIGTILVDENKPVAIVVDGRVPIVKSFKTKDNLLNILPDGAKVIINDLTMIVENAEATKAIKIINDLF